MPLPDTPALLQPPTTTSPTTLLLIDIQRGLNITHGFYGRERSTPTFEDNVSLILRRCRAYNASLPHSLSPITEASTHSNTDYEAQTQRHPVPTPIPLKIIHVSHTSSNPLSPLHPSGTTQKDGMEFMPCATPLADEPVLRKTTNSAFASTELAALLAQPCRPSQLIVVGIATDHCVSTSVRWAADLGIVHNGAEGTGRDGDEGKCEGGGKREGQIVVVGDATACFGKGEIDAETVQRVHLASLEGEFATVMNTREVLRGLFGEGEADY